MLTAKDFEITTLGPCTIDSPLERLRDVGFIEDSSRVRLQPKIGPQYADDPGLSIEEAGPRRKIHFDPGRTTAAVVTCGGLSPGLNNVIRSVYSELAYNYEIPRVLGVCNGYMGLDPASGLSAEVMRAQIRSMVVDLLMLTGLPADEARAHVPESMTTGPDDD